MTLWCTADNGTRYEGVPYTREEVEISILCFKGVDGDIELNVLLEVLYRDIAYVSLVRNGDAICDGWMRRGTSPEDAGRKYAAITQNLLETRPERRSVLVKFEEMMDNPFATATRLFRSLGLEPTELPKLRLKSKLVMSESGEHRTRFGERSMKYWLSPSGVAEVLDSSIDRRQSLRLDPVSRAAFERNAGEVLKQLGYLDSVSSLSGSA